VRLDTYPGASAAACTSNGRESDSLQLEGRVTERTMTPAEAAALLEVPVDAELEQVERAFRYQAQRSHPDRMAAATPTELAAAAARFDRFTLARSVLRAADDERRRSAPVGSGSADAAGSDGTQGGAGHPSGSASADEAWAASVWAEDLPYQPQAPAGPWVFWVWWALYVVVAAISFIGGPLPYYELDLWLRLVPLGLAAAAYARTGRPAFLAVVVALGGATAALTILYASFGPLLGMLLLAAPVLGLVSLGRQKRPNWPY
jgi:hypothetical protein